MMEDTFINIIRKKNIIFIEYIARKLKTFNANECIC